MSIADAPATQVFHMTILGRTIEHLGTQMYKHRAPSIAELIANCWDAGSKNVWLSIPESAAYSTSSNPVITIQDDGEGMDANGIETNYLVVGRNRREEDHGESNGRKVMGRKGIGKLAGFGLAGKVSVTTWRTGDSKAILFAMALQDLKLSAGKAGEIPFPWMTVDVQPSWPEHGTRIDLSQLRHSSPIDIESLRETLARRFSRTTRGQMQIHINNEPLQDPVIPSRHKFPPKADEFLIETLPSGKEVRYRYCFADTPIRSKEMQGFTIYAHERTAQAPPFFFNVESTASAQHSTRYVTGEIYADYLDDGTDSESDVISTDRQEIDWEKEELSELLTWGQALSRKALRDCSELKGKEVEHWIVEDNDFAKRLALLEPSCQVQISGFLKILGQKSNKDDERTKELADSLIRAYEFRTFHDVVDDIERASADPDRLEELLGRLFDWKVLESRAILEIVKGRLSIINKFEAMIIDDKPETASATTYDNLHDLLAEYPWLFNPAWQVYVEEKSISKILREKGIEDCPDDMRTKRIDFLAFEKDKDLIIIELKRPGHAVEWGEISRLQNYQVQLMRAHSTTRMVLVYGGTINVPESKLAALRAQDDLELLQWSEMFSRARSFYSHYESVLEGDISAPGFSRKRVEVSRTRLILAADSSHRSKDDRARGIGNADL